MNIWDILILLAVAAAVVLAVYHMKTKKSVCGSCCRTCDGCCPDRKAKEK